MDFTSLLASVGGGVSATAAYGITPTEPYHPIMPVSFPIHLSVTITISVLVAILFLAVYLQLVMVICFGYKLVSYQTVLLFNILLWAALRLTLYSFYFYHCCEYVNNLSVGWMWFLVAFPSALQYFSLAVLVHYFGESLFKVFERRQEMSSLVPPYRKMKKYRVLGWIVWLSAIFLFLGGNVAFSVLIHNYQDKELLVILRVVLLDGLFLIMGITLGILIILIYTTRAGRDVLETQGVHKCWPLLFSLSLILLFVSRAVYDIVAIRVADMKSFGFGWTFTTDMADYEFKTSSGDNKYGYIVYFVVLVVWEVLPTYLVVLFFRVKIPHKDSLTSTGTVNTQSQNRKHFFDDPNRYDAETDELLGSTHRSSSHMAIPGQYSQGGYGTTANYSAPGKYPSSINQGTTSGHSSYMPGTTPPQLFTAPSFFSDR